MTQAASTASVARPSSYSYEDILKCGRGELFGPGNAQLPLLPMLMFDRITHIAAEGGAYGKGEIKAELAIAGRPTLDWVFACHFKGDPVMPGCLGLDALWQLSGFFLGWMGLPGQGRASGVGEVKLMKEVTPQVKRVEYVIDVKRVIARKIKLIEADGRMIVDGELGYEAKDLRVLLKQVGDA